MAADERITRNSFLYMEPNEDSYGNSDLFAHCGSCFLWMGEKRSRCYILGKKLEVKALDTCGLYVNGKPEVERAGTEKNLVTVEEAGFQRQRPQCKRCYWYALGMCGLFVKLNSKDPDHFNMNPSVHKNGCCDAFTPLDAKFKNEGFFEIMNKKINLNEL